MPRQRILVFFIILLCFGGSPAAVAVSPEFDAYMSALERFKSGDRAGAIPEFNKLCFDPIPPGNRALSACMWLWVSLSAKGTPYEDLNKAFHVLTRSCSKWGDGLTHQPCFLAGSVAFSKFESLGVPREFSVEMFRKGCKEEGYMGVKEAMSCLRMGEAHTVGFGVEVDEIRASEYYTRACRAGIGQACFVLEVDTIEALNEWVSYSLEVDDREKSNNKFFELELVMSAVTFNSICNSEKSPHADACLWAGYAYQVQAIFLIEDEEKREEYLAKSQRIFKRGCELGSRDSCNKLVED